MTIKVTVFSNRVYVPYENFLKAVEYNKKHGIDLVFDFVRVDINGYKSILQKTINGAQQYFLTGTENLVTGTTDISILCIDGTEWKSPWYSRFPYKKDLPSSNMVAAKGKPLINLIYTKEDNTTGMIWLTICHELMHAYRLLANFKGIRTEDVMDTYFKNTVADFEDSDSNFSQQWKLLQPYLKPMKTDLSKWKLLPEIEKKAVQFFLDTKNAGYSLKITQGWRDPAYQDKLYAQGRTLPGKIVTNATGKQSKHCLGKAFDIAFIGKDPYPAKANWKAIGEIGKKCGLKWGGDFKSFVDSVHFEI